MVSKNRKADFGYGLSPHLSKLLRSAFSPILLCTMPLQRSKLQRQEEAEL